MKYTIKDVIHISDVDRGLIKAEDLIGKKAYVSKENAYRVLVYANDDAKSFCETIKNISHSHFETENKYSEWEYIILKKEPKYKYVPYEFSEETWNEIKNREVCMNQAQGKSYFTITELRQIRDRTIINGYEASIVGLSAKFLDTGEPVAKKVLIEEC